MGNSQMGIRLVCMTAFIAAYIVALAYTHHTDI